MSKNKVKTVSSFEYKKFKNIGKLENLEAFLAKLPEDQLIYQRKGQKLGCSDKVMQDYVISGENQCVQLVALADGHGTSDVVKLIADPEHGIKNILKTEGVVSRQAIGEAYHKINTDCKTQLAEINKANGDSKDDNVISGSTLSTVLVDSMNTTAATVGNTPVIFVTNEGEICISTDHNKDNPDEVKRFPEPQNEQTPAAPIFKFSRFWNTDKSYSLEISRDFGSASAEHEKFKPVPYINQKPTNKIAFFALLTDGALKESNGKTFLNELVSSMLSIQDCEKFTSKNLGAAYQSINRKKPPVPYQSFHDRDDESIILCRPKKAFRQNQSLSNDSQS